SLNVASSRSGELSPPSIGSFVDGRGVFYRNEALDGRSILVRSVISDITATSAHFEQAFSTDNGKTWEGNWVADDTRFEPTALEAAELDRLERKRRAQVRARRALGDGKRAIADLVERDALACGARDHEDAEQGTAAHGTSILSCNLGACSGAMSELLAAPRSGDAMSRQDR